MTAVVQKLAGKLGKHRPRRDPRTLRLATLLDRSVIEAPPLELSRTAALGDAGRSFDTYGNLEIGDCTCATWATIIELLTALRGDRIRIPIDHVHAMYTAIGGWDPRDPSTDRGASMTDAANYMRQIGLPDERGHVHTIGAWVSIDYLDELEMRIAARYFGAYAVGLALPLSAKDTSSAWDTDGSDSVEQTPGSWGGHSLTKQGYDDSADRLITWGFSQDATKRFARRYYDEAIVAIPSDLVSGTMPTPDGFKLDELRAALGRLT